MDISELALEWARIPSVTGHEQAILAEVERTLHESGWPVRRIPVSPGRFNLLAGHDSGKLLFSTHLDTVPPYLAPVRDGEVLRGRGVVDAKGIAAALFVAAEILRDKGIEVSILYVVGEETISDGALAAAESGLRFDYVLNGEPTDNVCVSAQKGNLRVSLTTRGRSCHSGYPEQGESAIHSLVELLNDILKKAWRHDAELGPTTVNVGRIEGGVADNVLAETATAHLMIRIVQPWEAVLKELTDFIGDRATVNVEKGVDPLHLCCPSGISSKTVAFGSDLPVLKQVGTPLMLGPGSILRAHGPDEYVTVAELEEAVILYVRIAELIEGGRI